MIAKEVIKALKTFKICHWTNG